MNISNRLDWTITRTGSSWIARNNDSETSIVARTLEELMRKINSHDNGQYRD